MALWKHQRKKQKRNTEDVQFISSKVILNPVITQSIDDRCSGGGSALYATETLIKMGFTHIHIIGVDMTDNYKVLRGAWNPENFDIKITSHEGFLNDLFN